MAHLIEKNEGKTIGYESIIIPPNKLTVLHSSLSLKIVKELAKEPGCAMDLARSLNQHEQKIYYHLNKLEEAGIIRQIRTEKRHAMTAKIYDVVCPVVSTKLYNDGQLVDEVCLPDRDIQKFLDPFIRNGKINSTIITGNPYPHGKYEATARHGVHSFDFGLFIGKFIKTLRKVNYKFDTQVTNEELKDNLILLGSPKTNVITYRINRKLPITFSLRKEWIIKSSLTGKTYDYDSDAVIIKTNNPLNPSKKLLLLAGKRSMGLRTAFLATINHYKTIMEGNTADRKTIARVVRGVDKDGDGIVDTVRFLE